VNPLIIRADATSESGTGHVMRCLALAQVWQAEGGQVVFISHCESEALRQRIRAEGIDLISLAKAHPDPFDWNLTRGILDNLKTRGTKSHAWLVVDGYHFDAGYQKGVKGAGNKLLWFDDYGHADHYYADLVLNQNLSADPSAYVNRESYTQLLMGPSYALLRREFKRWQGWQREIPTMARKVLVTLGGADPDNVSLKAIQALKQVDVSGLEARIVIGPANPHRELLKKELGDESRLHLLANVSDMSDLMAWADVSISAGGSTCWEQAFMGLPGLILVNAENQRANAEALGREGVGINLGWHQDLSVERLSSQLQQLMVNSESRSLMSQRGQNLIDGYGGWRLRNIMAGGTLKLRPVVAEDCERVWKWANDDSVRAASFSEAFITWEEHSRWFHERISRPYFYIALNQDDLPVGQVRFDQKEGETAISVMIDGAWRHRGYGVTLIRAACEEIFLNSDVKSIHAYVKPDNEASRMAFIRAGFKERRDNVRPGYPAGHFILVKC
jgi:UDP-2,4-diacetamido-2,4,6-trideoxy-beta-L-altropyranose hydrolase